MATVNIYLYFNGNCAEAFNHYKSTFNKDFQYVGYYNDLSKIERSNFPDSRDEEIMHIALPISKETTLMGSDNVNGIDRLTETKSNFSLFIHAESKDEANRLFNALSTDGKIKMPLAKQFWGSEYGICTDKFGIEWKISFNH